MMRYSTSAFLAGAFSLLLLSACSSGGGGGGAAKANITTDNYKDLAVAVAEGTKQATSLNNNQSSGFSSFLSKPTNSNNNVLTFGKVTRQIQQAQFPCDKSGFVDIPISLTTNQNLSNLNNLTITFNNCDDGLGDGAFNGTIRISGNIDGNYTVVISNFTSPAEGLFNFSGTVTCTANPNAIDDDCTFDATATTAFTGDIDNRSYTIDNMNVSGNASDGFAVNGTITDPDHGTIDITATALTFSCSGGQPSAGTVIITGANNATATITFNDCTSFTVSFNGIPQTFLWSAIF